MKFIKFSLFACISLAILGYGAYYYGTNFVSDQIVDTVSAEIDNEDNLHEIKQVVNNNPEIKKLVDEGAGVNEEDLPFTTVEEASKTIVKKVGLLELQKMYGSYANGITDDEVGELIKKFEGKLTEEEILAIKAIAYKELNK